MCEVFKQIEKRFPKIPIDGETCTNRNVSSQISINIMSVPNRVSTRLSLRQMNQEYTYVVDSSIAYFGLIWTSYDNEKKKERHEEHLIGKNVAVELANTRRQTR